MNFIINESKQKLRGGFYTQPKIAAFLSRWVLGSNPSSILEPSVGDGAFIESVAKERGPGPVKFFGCEIDPEEATKARERGRDASFDLEIYEGDFLKWFLTHGYSGPRFGGVLGNPPFIRYQYLPEHQQRNAEKVFSLFDLPFTNHTNAWVPFVVASLSLLEKGGRIGMVVPSEILHIPHSQSLRRYLATQCSKILIVDPEELWFDDALQGVVLILAEKKRSPSDKSYGVAVEQVKDVHALEQDPQRLFARADYVNGDSIHGKWMSVFLTGAERTLIHGLRDSDEIKTFDEIAEVDVGIVTGANDFFLVPDSVVKQYRLEKWTHPMFGRSGLVDGVIYRKSDQKRNGEAGLRTNFLWFKADDPEDYSASVRRYFQLGEEQMLHTRYKCRIREPWFKVPSVHTAPVAMLKRSHHYPRLVLNEADVYTTDTAYRVTPTDVDPKTLVFSFLNSLTCLSAELEGRHYGGGVLELVPSEIERLLIPIHKPATGELARLDATIRKREDPGQMLRAQDDVVLGGLGLTKADRNSLNSAWDRLRLRRQRNSHTAEPATKTA